MSEFGHKLSFDKNGIAVCPESNQRYQLKDGHVVRI
jgi:UDP-2-acetamido-3-amino-2,3-dideoxy-glucuronate N-acetyltransferase